MSDFAQVNMKLTQLLAEAGTAAELMVAILRLLTRELSFDYATLWRADYDLLQLHCVATWHESGPDTSLLDAVSKTRIFEYGVGLPGEVWREKCSIHHPDLSTAGNFPRATLAVEAGIHGAVGFPVITSGRVVAVIELFCAGRFECGPDLLAFLRLAGSQIGLFVERLRVEEQLTSSDAQFLLLARKAVEPIVTIDENSTILFVNPQMENLFGYTQREMVGESLAMIIPPRLRPAHNAGIARYLATGERKLDWDGVTLPAVHRDGTEFLVEVRFGEVMRGSRRTFSGFLRRVP